MLMPLCLTNLRRSSRSSLIIPLRTHSNFEVYEQNMKAHLEIPLLLNLGSCRCLECLDEALFALAFEFCQGFMSIGSALTAPAFRVLVSRWRLVVFEGNSYFLFPR